jgi:hypothetical protein
VVGNVIREIGIYEVGVGVLQSDAFYARLVARAILDLDSLLVLTPDPIIDSASASSPRHHSSRISYRHRHSPCAVSAPHTMR